MISIALLLAQILSLIGLAGPYDCYTARWLRGKDADLKAIADKYGFNVGLDGNEEYVYLAPNRVNLQMAQERYPEIEFLSTREIS